MKETLNCGEKPKASTWGLTGWRHGGTNSMFTPPGSSSATTWGFFEFSNSSTLCFAFSTANIKTAGNRDYNGHESASYVNFHSLTADWRFETLNIAFIGPANKYNQPSVRSQRSHIKKCTKLAKKKFQLIKSFICLIRRDTVVSISIFIQLRKHYVGALDTNVIKSGNLKFQSCADITKGSEMGERSNK